VGGLAYLSEIVTSVPLSANAVDYARIVKEKSILRRTIAATRRSPLPPSRGRETSTTSSTARSRSSSPRGGEDQAFLLLDDRDGAGGDEGHRAALRAEGADHRGPTGFVDLDNVTSGFQKSDMIVVAAAPEWGRPPCASTSP